MVEIKELTVAQAHDGFKSGSFTAKDLAAAFLDRIAQLDKAGPRINAMMAMSTTALEDAAVLDEYFRKTGQFKGPLHGIPIVADTKGMVTTYGSAATKNNVPDEDAVVVTKLKEAGAVVLGKTTVAEWACVWFSANGATDYEFTKNPYNLAHDVGASSGGSGAALAANFAILAVGEDTGGSIRVPSSFCNLVGIRVTPGLISRTGFCPLVKNLDTPGPMARTVTDCALMLDSMVGFDPKDGFTGFAATAAALGLPRGGSYTAYLEEGPSKIAKAKVGVVRQRFGSDSDPLCKAVNTVMSSAMAALAAAGTTFVDVEIEDLEHLLDRAQTYYQRSRADINAFLATKPHLPQDVADMVPLSHPDKPYMDFVCGVAHGPTDPETDPSYAGRILAGDELRRRVNCALAAQGLDALVLPDVQVPAPQQADATNERFAGKAFPTNTFLASLARLPAVSVPAGFTTAEQGTLPVGMELVGLEFQEQNLLELARGVEVLIGARRPPPEL
ncbi:hypothetical protein JX265_007244 [Neoarthrinium moseri]|uniref:Amidase domain-containing protein n=1 Tax=Neoarthrinium moseri TaxID=1658444 RepID=A0A9P9WK95_9PEZI|nr:uncharacterized protein JN550_012116 [Neoarthrinium moseri]KAI1850919.1 hypothetical protein JX266_003584 [Neoarthrinium moseri]KAI1859307.1 hypothetical protein JN550_012116 [Neoarthrinium moseri]KAI1867442.1 hypothetical protein JX265_007244 [Neoarthrinium moseri]